MDWLFDLLAGLLAVAGLVIGLRALFADRARGRRRCPKCWYDMSGTGSLTCSECGYVAARPRRLLRTRRHWRAAIVAGVLLFGAWLADAWPGVRQRGWTAAVPTTSLIAAPWPSWNAAMTHELQARLWNRELFGWQQQVLVRRAAARLDDGRAEAAGALRWLGSIGPAARSATPEVIAAARSGDPHLRRAAATTLRDMLADDRDAVLALAGLLADADGEVRVAAARALLKLAEHTAAPLAGAVGALTGALGDPAWTVRVTSAHALGLVSPDPAAVIPVLRDLLGSDNVYARCAAIEALADFAERCEPAVELLILALDDRKRVVRESAVLALMRIDVGGRVPVPEASRPGLQRLAGGGDERIRDWALTALDGNPGQSPVSGPPISENANGGPPRN